MLKKKYKDRLKVLFVTSELTPIAKAGGLGDVVGQLPKELAREYHMEIKVVMPKYKFIRDKDFDLKLIIDGVKLLGPDNKPYKLSVWKTFIPETIVPVYLIDCPEIFNGESVYDHNPKQVKFRPYTFLAKISLELIRVFDWRPDVVHIHDGMMGMLPKWLETTYAGDPMYAGIASVLTIHNLAHQPGMSLKEAKYVGLQKKNFKDVKKFLKLDYINIMAEAINSSDFVNTVSPTYAREVMTKKYGAGLDKLLRKEKNKFTGILNGMDYSGFDPRTNEDTPVKYWINNLDKKVENKLYLQKKLGLTQSAETPLICVISRLATQKGLELVDEVLEELVDMGAQFVVLGSGQKSIEKVFIKAEKEHPKEIAAEIGFDANFAQTIYAGADMLLMPSRFEPCGLSQIIAMRFGTIPIVRSTGGLADTVKDDVTGFVFNHYDKHAFLWAIRRAVDVYYNQKEHWKNMQIAGMKKDFSWKKSAKKYIWLYKKAIKNHKDKLNEDSK